MTATAPVQTLLDSIQNREATIGVIGLGYVGLPLVLLFSESGFRVVGFDVDDKKVEALKRGESYIRHIGPERVAAAFTNGRAEATAEYDRLSECDAILICVPTPLGNHREPDLKYVRMTAEAIAKRLRKGQLIVLESTTYP
ncbi:MAG TPA: NAD(P)-binding domain-containing protein, partial [Thermoanaerobaculia bacterium]